jgi:hypothetical protein
MKNFLAIYTGSEQSMARARWEKLSNEERAAREVEAMAAWGKWVQDHEAAIVDNGAPLGKTKCVTPEGISDIRNVMAAYTIVRAENHDAAAKMFVDHPHFSIFPGEGVEIMECLPMPG